MSVASVMQASQGLNASVEALAALGAALRIRSEGMRVDPDVASLLDRVIEAIQPGGIEDLTADQAAIVLAFVRAFFRQALDLLENPARAPGWSFEDPVILQAQGQASRSIAQTFCAYAEKDPDFAAALSRPARLLDVGTGVGWLAIECARLWPAMQVLGIDIFEPALVMARGNVAAADIGARVAFRNQDIADLDEVEAFDLSWFSGPFIAADKVPESLRQIARATKPGGWLVFGTYNPPPSELGRLLTGLRIVRSGGRPWSEAEAADLIEAAGFELRGSFTTGSPVLVVVGRKAGKPQ